MWKPLSKEKGSFPGPHLHGAWKPTGQEPKASLAALDSVFELVPSLQVGAAPLPSPTHAAEVNLLEHSLTRCCSFQLS